MIYINDFSRKFEIDLYLVCENSPYGSRIISYHTAYHGKKYNFLDFWIQRDENNKAVCAFCRYYSTLIICGDSHNKAEIEDFVSMLSLSNILCDSKLNLNFDMNLSIGETMACTKLSEGEYSSEYKISKLSSDMSNLKAVYSVLASENNNSSLPDFESYFLDISHKIRHGVSTVYAIYDSIGNIISTAAVLAVSKTSAVIGCVATVTEERNKGLATAIVRYAAAKELHKNRTVYLHREKYISIYEKIGFETVGYWNEFSKRV